MSPTLRDLAQDDDIEPYTECGSGSNESSCGDVFELPSVEHPVLPVVAAEWVAAFDGASGRNDIVSKWMPAVNSPATSHIRTATARPPGENGLHIVVGDWCARAYSPFLRSRSFLLSPGWYCTQTVLAGTTP